MALFKTKKPNEKQIEFAKAVNTIQRNIDAFVSFNDMNNKDVCQLENIEDVLKEVDKTPLYQSLRSSNYVSDTLIPSPDDFKIWLKACSEIFANFTAQVKKGSMPKTKTQKVVMNTLRSFNEVMKKSPALRAQIDPEMV